MVLNFFAYLLFRKLLLKFLLAFMKTLTTVILEIIPEAASDSTIYIE
jgi:hypothetical protein